MTQQGEFSFGEQKSSADGYTIWANARKLAALDLAKRINMPLNHRVEVWLRGQVRLRGILHLRHEQLFVEEGQERHLEFLVDHVPFSYGEIESCLRLD